MYTLPTDRAEPGIVLVKDLATGEGLQAVVEVQVLYNRPNHVEQCDFKRQFIDDIKCDKTFL